MKRILVFLGVFVCFSSYGQRDSLVGKTWMGGLADYLKFDTLSKQATFIFYVSQDKNTSSNRYTYSINDSIVTLNGIGSIQYCEINLRYQYLKNSLVMEMVSINRSCVENVEKYKRRLILKAKPSSLSHAFEKLTLTNGGADITLDSLGNLFLRSSRPGYPQGFFGDYRGRLNDTTFKKLKDLIAENRMDSLGRKYGDIDYFNYILFYGGEVYEGNAESENAEKPISYLLNSLKEQPLEFQNYVGGDSVNGMLMIVPLMSYHYVASGTLHKIGVYKSGRKYEYGAVMGGYIESKPIEKGDPKVELSIYRFNLGKVYYGEEVVRPGPIYILSDTSLTTNEEKILVFQNETPHALYSNRKGPAVCVPIRQLDMPEEGDTVIVPSYTRHYKEHSYLNATGDGDRRKWVKLFGKYYETPFKTDFSKAYKKYILKDWEDLQREGKK